MPQTATLPARTSSTDAGDDLDARILRVEQRLIEREERLRRGLDGLSSRFKRAASPSRLLGPGAIAGVLAALGGVVLWLWRGRRSGYARPIDTAASGQQRGSSAEAPWVSLLALAWPLLPSRWRARISPATASAIVALGLPIAQGLLRGRSGPPPVAAGQVDLARFGGTWYEVARLPSIFEGRCAGQPQADYLPRGDGSLRIINRCPDADGKMREASGIGLPLQGGNGAKLRVSLWPLWLRWLPLAWSDYWILHVDERYTEALVATPDRRHLWLLSRRRKLAPARLQALQQAATMQGFVIARLQIVQPD